jgi:serine/threonine-protein kinase RIM15
LALRLEVEQIIGQRLMHFLAPADVSVVSDASRALVEDADAHIAHVRFRLQVSRDLRSVCRLSRLSRDMLTLSPLGSQIIPDAVDVEPDREPGPVYLEMEGTGMLIRNIAGQAIHVMWVAKPVGGTYVENPVDELGGQPQTPQGLSFHRRSSTQPVTPFPTGGAISTQILLCRICERDVPTWYFEKHSETCHEIHRLEADISEQNDRVGEILKAAEALLAMYEPSERPATPTYRGTAVASRLQHALPLSPAAARAAQHAAQCNLIKHVIQNLQTCLELSTPSLKDETAALPIEEQRLLSPRSEEYMSTLSVWSRPQTEDAALTRLIDDCIAVCRGKVNAINRLRNTIVYSERVRREWQDKVEEQLAALSEEDETSGSEDSASTSAEDPVGGPPSQEAQVKDRTETRPVTLHLTVPTISGPEPSRSPSWDGQSSALRMPSQVEIDARRPYHHRRLSSRTDYTDLSSSPVLPSAFEASPTRIRKTSGRLSMSSETAPLSPRLPCITPASRSTSISIKDFEIIKPISKGAFGSVYLAKKKTTGDHYAIKILKKADMISKNQVTNVKAERKILMNQAESPYVVRLFFTFRASRPRCLSCPQRIAQGPTLTRGLATLIENKHYLFLVMEYLPGGDLAALVKMLGTLGEEWTRRFIAEVVLGLEALHSKGVVHRCVLSSLLCGPVDWTGGADDLCCALPIRDVSDLKPDNLLIDKDGHLKLTDFGLSKIGLLGRQAGGSRFSIPRGRQHGGRTEGRLDLNDSPPAFSPGSQVSGSYAAFSQSSYFNDGRQSGEESSGSDYAPRHKRNTAQTAALGVSLQTALGLKSRAESEHTPPISETHKFVGTVDYVAPESILGLANGDDASVDWVRRPSTTLFLLPSC